jgi:acyl-CoA synthetase (NDP forming)
MADTPSFVAAARVLAQADEVDALVVSAVPATPTLDVLAPDLTGEHDENVYRVGSLVTELIRLRADIEKPLVVTIDSGRLYDASTVLLERAGIPVYRKIDRATRALSAWVSRAMWTND